MPDGHDDRSDRFTKTDIERQRKWYAVYTMSRHEKKIAGHCEQAALESFLPLYRTRRLWKNRITADVQLPLFPNYIFLHLAPSEHIRLLRLPGVLSTVGNAAGPSVVPDRDIDGLREIVRCRQVEPYTSIAVGDAVRIRIGPLEGLTGIVIRMTNGLRMVVTLNAINKSIAVDVDASELELLQPRLSPENVEMHRRREMAPRECLPRAH